METSRSFWQVRRPPCHSGMAKRAMSAGANCLVDARMFLACGHFLMTPHVETKSEFVHE